METNGDAWSVLVALWGDSDESRDAATDAVAALAAEGLLADPGASEGAADGLTAEERESIDMAAPPVVEGVEGWEWGVLYHAVERILAARQRPRQDEEPLTPEQRSRFLGAADAALSVRRNVLRLAAHAAGHHKHPHGDFCETCKERHPCTAVLRAAGPVLDAVADLPSQRVPSRRQAAGDRVSAAVEWLDDAICDALMAARNGRYDGRTVESAGAGRAGGRVPGGTGGGAMSARRPRFEIVRGEDGWWARFRAANGRVVWVTETYRHYSAALRAVDLIADGFAEIEVREVDER